MMDLSWDKELLMPFTFGSYSVSDQDALTAALDFDEACLASYDFGGTSASDGVDVADIGAHNREPDGRDDGPRGGRAHPSGISCPLARRPDRRPTRGRRPWHPP